jgi:hypothetical protein
MTTLYSLEKLHKELEAVISSDLAKFRRHMPGGFGISYGARSQLKGKCKREHAFLKTFVPLNRSLDKYLQQASVASMHDIDLSRSRFKDAASNLALALFERYVETVNPVHNAALLALPLSGSQVRNVPTLAERYSPDLLEKLTGTTLGELRESFALLAAERRAVEELESNKRALALEGILKKLKHELSQTEHALLTQAVRKSYTVGQQVFLKL